MRAPIAGTRIVFTPLPAAHFGPGTIGSLTWLSRNEARLQRVAATGAAEPLGARQRREAAANQQAIPQRAILIEEQDRLA